MNTLKEVQSYKGRCVAHKVGWVKRFTPPFSDNGMGKTR